MRVWLAIVAAVMAAAPTMAAVDLSEAAFKRSDDKLCTGNYCVKEQRWAYEKLVRDHDKAKGKWRQLLEDVVESQTFDGVTDWAAVDRMRPDTPLPRATSQPGWSVSSTTSSPSGSTMHCDTHVSGDGHDISTKCY